jgi:hypothetical protein
MKIGEDLGKIKNEDSKGLVRLYRGRNFVPKSQDILYGSKHPKGRKNREIGLVHTHMRLRHAPRA